MVWFAPCKQIGIVFTLNNNNNNRSSPASLEEECQGPCPTSNLGQAKLVRAKRYGCVAADKVVGAGKSGGAAVGSVVSLVWAEKLAVRAGNAAE